MAEPSERGLPPRIYLPIVIVVAALFLGVMAYLIVVGFGVTGSVFGKTGNAASVSAGSQTSVQGGGPPPAVMEQLATLRARIAEHPNDDVAITQLADEYLAAGKYAQAIPLYKRALAVNPKNVAAQTGLAEAQESLRESQQ
ncbi:MAG TPA: tetratricopeptide repeat protein [Candidatus Acidoferrales bacterium]|nr:tetratricopeptide repeat protein [Candidatus Acidoferrales bacterium]